MCVVQGEAGSDSLIILTEEVNFVEVISNEGKGQKGVSGYKTGLCPSWNRVGGPGCLCGRGGAEGEKKRVGSRRYFRVQHS